MVWPWASKMSGWDIPDFLFAADEIDDLTLSQACETTENENYACKTYKRGMAQREMNNKTIRHYCQPGKLIYYIFNFQRGSPEGYSQTFPVPRLVVFFWVQIFGFTVSWVYNLFFCFLVYSKYWYFYGVTLIKMHILTYFLLI